MGMVGVATADAIAGPYTFVSGWRPDAQRSLDLTLFEEADKSAAYLVRSVDNAFAGFSRLTDDCQLTRIEPLPCLHYRLPYDIS